MMSDDELERTDGRYKHFLDAFPESIAQRLRTESSSPLKFWQSFNVSALKILSHHVTAENYVGLIFPSRFIIYQQFYGTYGIKTTAILWFRASFWVETADHARSLAVWSFALVAWASGF